MPEIERSSHPLGPARSEEADAGGGRPFLIVLAVLGAYTLVAAIALAPVAFALSRPATAGGWVLLAASLLWALVLLARLAVLSRPFDLRGADVALERGLGGELRTLIDGVAQLNECRAPDRVLLWDRMEVKYLERASWLGLRARRTELLVHPSLLAGLTADHLLALVAAEFARNSGRRPAAERTAERVHETLGLLFAKSGPSLGLAGTVLRLYFWPILRRRQEVVFRAVVAADAAAARQAGADTLHAALAGQFAFQRAWRLFEEHYLASRYSEVRRKFGPSGFLEGFEHFTHGRAAQLWRIPTAELSAAPAWWSTEPSVGYRLAPLGIDAEFQATENDGATADSMVAGFAELVAAFEERVLNRGKETLAWSEYSGRAFRTAQEPRAKRAVRALKQVSGRSTGLLDWWADEVAAGRGAAVDHRLRRAGMPEDGLWCVLVLIALDSGRFKPRTSWTGPLELVDDEGRTLTVASIPEGLDPIDPASAAVFRAELAAAGIDIEHELAFDR